MPKAVTIAVDAMGGDGAPAEIVRGMAISLDQGKFCLSFRIYGRAAEIEPYLKKYPAVLDRCTIVDCPETITDTEPVSTRTLKKVDSSLYQAIHSVRTNESDAVFSGGNSGALTAMASVLLSRLDGVDRPAMLSTFPALTGPVTFLDCGANIYVNATNLIQFAIMGDLWAKLALNIPNPRVCLLNVGIEEHKGTEALQEANSILLAKAHDLNYVGFVESDGMPLGRADVFVTDGYAGNMMLKSIEGVAQLVRQLLGEAFRSSWRARLAYLLMRSEAHRTIRHIDHRHYNGALVTGLQSVAVKSHGSSDGYAIAHAINLTAQLVEKNFIDQMRSRLSILDWEKAGSESS